jgi:hypothetical protein
MRDDLSPEAKAPLEAAEGRQAELLRKRADSRTRVLATVADEALKRQAAAHTARDQKRKMVEGNNESPADAERRGKQILWILAVFLVIGYPMYDMGRTTGNDYLSVFGLLGGLPAMVGIPYTLLVTLKEKRGGWWDIARLIAGLWAIYFGVLVIDAC